MRYLTYVLRYLKMDLKNENLPPEFIASHNSGCSIKVKQMKSITYKQSLPAGVLSSCPEKHEWHHNVRLIRRAGMAPSPADR